MGGHLATVSNASENSFLFNTWPSGWIGYYQDKVPGYTFSEPAGGYRWTETQVTDNLGADYDVSSYSVGTTLVDIRSAINATLYNSPTYSSTGGKYLAFNGSNHYAITNNLASKFTNTSISVVAWVYPTGNGVIASELSAPSASSSWHESIIEIIGSNTLKVGFWNGSGITQLSTTISLNTWHMICITYDGSTMKGYLNNVNFGSTNFSRQAAFLGGGNSQHFAFGLSDATNMGHGGYGSFRLGLIQFYGRAITVDEIDRTFNLYAYRYRLNQYTNWNSGEPNNAGTEDYTQFVGGGKWNDLPNSSLPYVIEFDYVVTTTPWVLHQTVYTSSTGSWSFSQPTNPATEWYIQIDATNPTSLLQQSDLTSVGNVVIGQTTTKSIHWNMYDVNNDGKITVSDKFYVSGKRQGLFGSWISSSASALFTLSQYNALNGGTTNQKSTYPGVNTITINSPVSGSSVVHYMIAPGYAGQVTY